MKERSFADDSVKCCFLTSRPYLLTRHAISLNRLNATMVFIRRREKDFFVNLFCFPGKCQHIHTIFDPTLNTGLLLGSL